jgi:hypothetical protein
LAATNEIDLEEVGWAFFSYLLGRFEPFVLKATENILPKGSLLAHRD